MKPKDQTSIKDLKLRLIKDIVHSVLPGQIILFGSRARNNFDKFSDYDLLIITPQSLSIKEKMKLSTQIRKKLLEHDIAADVIINSVDEVEEKKSEIGNIVKYALQEGVEI